MRTGLVKPGQYSANYPTNVLSPGVWDTCPGSDLNQLGTGKFSFLDYQDGVHPAALSFTDAGSTTASGVAFDNSSTLQANGSSTNAPYAIGHVITLTPGSTTAASFLGRQSIVTRPIIPLTPGSAGGTWFEAGVTITTASTQTAGMFVGLVTLPGISTGSTIVAVTATKSTNQLQPSTGLVGFWMHGDTPNNFDAVYQGPTGSGFLGTASSTVQTVLANVLTSSTGAIVTGSVYAAPIGPIVPPGILTSTQITKLGIKYLPQVNQVQFYVNGAQVAAVAVTSTNFDITNPYGSIVEIGGSTSTSVAKVDFLGHAGQQLY